MRETKIKNQVTSIPIDKLVAHPGNPNRMSKRNFSRLIRNIERTGRYEPLVVRRQGDCFQIINGHHRCQALKQLGYQTADAVVWDVDDTETDILLSTINRLGGSDALEKKLTLLDRINRGMHDREMAKLLPFTRSQIKKLKNIRIPTVPAKINVKSFAVPMVFFLSDAQQQIVEQALSLAREALAGKTKAARNAAALTEIAQTYAVQHEGCYQA
jgi:ParB-like chromosome segregation protein Spo0J